MERWISRRPILNADINLTINLTIILIHFATRHVGNTFNYIELPWTATLSNVRQLLAPRQMRSLHLAFEIGKQKIRIFFMP
jgi:hypothetical protein